MTDTDTRRGFTKRIALAMAGAVAAPSLVGRSSDASAAQADDSIAITVQPWLCPPGYDGGAFPTDCTTTPDPADVNLSIWWGKTGGEGPGRHFVETTPAGNGVSGTIPLPAGETTTLLIDNRFSQTENPPFGGAVCTGGILEGPAVNHDYGSISMEITGPDDIACDVYLVPAATSDNGEVAEGSPDADPTAEEEATSQAAIAFSELEAAGDFDQLYNLMHPEARALIPRAAVVGWFTDAYAPTQPGVITEVTNVEFLDWTWPVSGKTYPDTAQVSYLQPFGPAGEEEIVEGMVRLVEIGGEWTWFFGRDADFVAEQIATYAPDFTPLGDGNIGDAPPWNIADTPPDVTLDQVVAALPTEIAGHILYDEPRHNDIPGAYPFASESMQFLYPLPGGDHAANVVVNVTALPTAMTAADALPQIEDEGFSAQALSGDPPPFKSPRSDYAAETVYFLAVETIDADSSRPFFVWGPRNAHTIISVWAPNDIELELTIDAIIAALTT